MKLFHVQAKLLMSASLWPVAGNVSHFWKCMTFDTEICMPQSRVYQCRGKRDILTDGRDA